MVTGRKHWHVSYADSTWHTHTYRTFDKAKADAKLAEFKKIAPAIAPETHLDRCENHPAYGTPEYGHAAPCTCKEILDGYRPICYQTPCSDHRHEKNCEE